MKARQAGVNISAVAARAVRRAIQTAEKEAGEPVKTAPAATPGSQGAM